MWFAILGPLQVHDGETAVDVPKGRQRGLLAALMMQPGNPVSAGALAEVLWDGSPPPGADVTLRSHVLRLRRALGPQAGARLVTRHPGYLLQASEDEVDVLRFRALCRHGHAALREGAWARAEELLDTALGLWRGAPLADIPSEQLIREEVPGLADLRLQAEEWRADAALHLGRHAELVPGLRSLAAQHPLRERFHGQLMLALYRCDRQAEALAAYQHARGILVAELGTEPGPGLQDLHQRILSADSALARPGPGPGRTAEPATLTSIPAAAGAAADTGDVAEAGHGPPGPVAISAQQRLDKASRELALAVARQWTAEAVMRSLGRPEPIQLRWSITHRTAAAALATGDPRTREPVPPNLHGKLADLITVFRQLPKRQLVVLGEPGAGKTALAVLLTLGLLTDPEPHEPVPVLLPMSSWDPRREHLYTWLAHKLTEEYSGLGNVVAYGPHAAQRLVADERVLPVLDGLDEMPPELQAAAIDAIDLATAGGRPFIVTCRSAEYEEAVRREGVILASAAVVEMQPVEIADAARFLTARQYPGHARWQPVVEHLRGHPQGPLAHVMSTPLMVDLARTAYSGAASDPAELSDGVRFPDPASIEEHLLDAFLPAAYPQQIPRLSSAAGISAAGLLRYEPEQARRWLTFLAQHLHGARTHDLVWWRLAEAISPPTRGLIFALLPALVFAAAGELAGGTRVGIVYGVAFGLAGFAAHSLGKRPIPLCVELRFRGTAARFLRRFAIGLAIGVVLGLAWSLSRGLVLMLGLVFGLALGAHVWLDTPADASRVSSPLTVLKQDRTAALSYTLTFALSIGTFYAVADTFTKRTVFIPVLGGSFDIALALACGIAAVPLARFAFGRTGAVAYGFAAAAVGGLVFPPARTLVGGFLTGTIFGIAIGLTIFLSRAWGSFILTRAWLATRGKTPLRFMRFLADTHRRAVLRQAGAVYQFRHARLQDNLANRRNS
jgi:DNA-binding SARP family transcriptional activator